jgi:hypothetical protein
MIANHQLNVITDLSIHSTAPAATESNQTNANYIKYSKSAGFTGT